MGSARSHGQAFLCLVEDLNYFDFEDRKQIQTIVCELLSVDGGNNVLAVVLKGAGATLLPALLR